MGSCSSTQLNTKITKSQDEDVESGNIPSGPVLKHSLGVLQGDPTIKVEADFKIVRIFISSTFVVQERNALMKNVYPQLKNFCQRFGYEFQVVDMRWGIRGEATDDHLTEELCMREIKLCQKLSTGPNFVSFLSHRYGYRSIPPRIGVQEFLRITQACGKEDRALLDVWFRRDDNAVPAEYVLQRISSNIPDFVATKPESQKEARAKWEEISEHLQSLLMEGAKRTLSTSSARTYQISITEKEIVEGIERHTGRKKNCFCFKRIIKGIEEDNSSQISKSFYDKSETNDGNAQQMLKELIDDRLPGLLDKTNMMEYTIPWTGEGIVPDQNAEHNDYIKHICADFHQKLQEVIKESINARQSKATVHDEVYSDIIQHINFCRSKCESFSGRQTITWTINDYILKRLHESSVPLVLYGQSGCGKTSIMAVTVRNAWKKLKGKCTLVFRFLGTTRFSGSLSKLLLSLTSQIMWAYEMEHIPQATIHDMVEDFQKSLTCATSKQPLVLLLDSLDQLDNIDGGRQLHWLPKKLPPHVKLIFSTLPDEKYQVYPCCKALYGKANQFLLVPDLEPKELQEIRKDWSRGAGRTFTADQSRVLDEAFSAHPVPLYMKLSMHEALQWHSYELPDTAVLATTVPEIIDRFLERLEKKHGELLISHALGFLTISQNGLTEGEIEDMLSLSDEVLNDVYQFWNPPIRRLPPLLWVRVENDIQDYIVHKGVDGVLVSYWFHRQFIDAAHRRYLSTEKERLKYHSTLSEFFVGVWAEKPKPYTSEGKELAEPRFVAKQPNRFVNGTYNFRKLRQLPYHVINARQVDTLKIHTLCNYEFLVDKIKATTFLDVMSDLKMARAAFPEDLDLQLVTETLQLSQEALTHDGHELASQLVGRVSTNEAANIISQNRDMLLSLNENALKFLAALEAIEGVNNKATHFSALIECASKPHHPTLLPNRAFLEPPGGQIVHQVMAHTDTLTDIDISEDGEFVITGSKDKTVKLWSVNEGDLKQSVTLKEEVGYVRFITDDRDMLASCANRRVYLIDVQLGFLQHVFEAPNSNDSDDMVMPIAVCVDSNNCEFMIAMRNEEVDQWDVAERKLIATNPLRVTDKSRNHGDSNMQGRILLSHGEHYCYCLFRGSSYVVESVSDKKFRKIVQVFGETSAEPDVDHISDMAITGDGDKIIVCNGATLDLHICEFKSGAALSKITKKQSSISHLYLPPGSEWVYFTTGVHIGVWNLLDNTEKVSLRHPCRPTKVVGFKAAVIATIAEDNMLRVWDITKDSVEQNMTNFIGKVNVSGDKPVKALIQSILGDDISADAIDSLLTTEETLNYWTCPGKAPRAHLKVVTRMFLLDGEDHVVAVQDAAGGQYSICLSVWDLRQQKCMRRAFLPAQSEYVHVVCGNATAVVSANQKLKLLDLRDFEIKQVLQGLTVGQRLPHVCYSKATNELVTESRGGHYLKIYHLTAGEVVGKLIPSSQNLTHAQVQFHSLKINNGGAVAALCGPSSRPNQVICLWNLATRELIRAVTLSSWFNEKGHYIVHSVFSSCGKFLAVQKDMPTAKAPAKNDTVVLEISTGKICYVAHAEHEKASQVTTVCLLRRLKATYVQMIGIDKDGNAISITHKSAGLNAKCYSVTEDQKYVVTWCNNPLEKTLRLWKYEESKLEVISSFTPDNELTEVCMTSDGKRLIIDGETGIVVLQMPGNDQEVPLDNGIYTSIDLNIKYPESAAEEFLQDDGSDKDMDTDS